MLLINQVDCGVTWQANCNWVSPSKPMRYDVSQFTTAGYGSIFWELDKLMKASQNFSRFMTNLWLLMNTCGYLRLLAVTYDYLWLLVVTCGYLWLRMVTCGYLWDICTFPDDLKDACESLGLPQINFTLN